LLNISHLYYVVCLVPTLPTLMKAGISLGKSAISDVGMQLWCVYMMPVVRELCLILILGLTVTYSFNTYLNKVHELVWYLLLCFDP
jgi:hypothetical protein